ncbi:unnamed protein product [Rotaria sp. Silwood2]|nr:unnamed protein product [Rotaria sp. Silwood2]CAF4549577.1 unnamed protein product [Rotaria sp. Silwood2]
MGASESIAIQVNLNRPDRFYFVGEQVSGNILFQNDHNQLKLEEIILKLVGELGYTTQESRSSTDINGNTTTENYTDYHDIPFFTISLPLARPIDGQQKMILDRGTYTWPFEFSLPENLPPSSSPNNESYPHIKYYTQVILGRQWYKSNMTKTHIFTISPRMNILHMNDIQETQFFTHQNRKQLRLQCCLLQDVIVPGKTLSFQIKLHNPRRSKIKRIEAIFMQCRQTAFDRHNEIIVSADLPNLNEFNELYLQRNFELLVPNIYLTPTSSFSTSFHGYSHYITVHYELKLQIKSHGVFTDFQLSVPVIVDIETISEQ